MGFLKRLFSVGKKRNKRKHSSDPKRELVHLAPVEEDEQEAAASRLLRSTSSRFAVVHEVDYSSLPPLPHPINNVLLTPATSVVSVASTPNRGTYTVTVHGRTRHHSKTSLPPPNDDESTPQQCSNQNYDQNIHPTQKHLPVTPRDQKHLLGLRTDPSVASLLNMYDEHGCLDSKVFSNSPPSPLITNGGRSQTKRTGSTLRQLLGGPSSMSSRQSQVARQNSDIEGDISWAERFLDERLSATSSTSSLVVPHTPTDTLFPHDPSIHDPSNDNTTHSFNTTGNYPTFSSMEVELSNSESTLPFDASVRTHHPNPYENANPKTPQRASEVFGFLTDKKDRQRDRPPPALPLSRFSSDDSFYHDDPLRPSKIPILHDTPLYRSQSSRPPLDDGEGYEHAGLSVNRAKSDCCLTREGPRGHQGLRVSSIFRGSRGFPPLLHPAKSVFNRDNHQRYRETGAAVSGHHIPESTVTRDEDRFTRIPSRTSQNRKASCTLSLASAPTIGDEGGYPRTKTGKDQAARRLDKENEQSDLRFLAAYHPLPKTPMRTNAHAHSRAVFFSPPSPASSTELSPVAKQMMTNLREKRTRARAAERTRGKLTGMFVSLKP